MAIDRELLAKSLGVEWVPLAGETVYYISRHTEAICDIRVDHLTVEDEIPPEIVSYFYEERTCIFISDCYPTKEAAEKALEGEK